MCTRDIEEKFYWKEIIRVKKGAPRYWATHLLTGHPFFHQTYLASWTTTQDVQAEKDSQLVVVGTKWPFVYIE